MHDKLKTAFGYLGFEMKISCNNCAVSPVCLPVGLNEREVQKLDRVVQRKPSLKAGQHLCYQHGKFMNFYAVQSGSFKKYTVTGDGREQISEFYLPGEFVGLDAVDSGEYDSSVVSLEPSTVCEIPFEKLLMMASETPSLQRQVIRLMSQRLKYADAIRHNSQAIERVAAFLLNIVTRYRRYHADQQRIYLSMSRQEIGNYLGLAVETVSRVFTELNRKAVISTHAKELTINDFRRLQTLACSHSLSSQ